MDGRGREQMPQMEEDEGAKVSRAPSSEEVVGGGSEAERSSSVLVLERTILRYRSPTDDVWAGAAGGVAGVEEEVVAGTKWTRFRLIPAPKTL